MLVTSVKIPWLLSFALHDTPALKQLPGNGPSLLQWWRKFSFPEQRKLLYLFVGNCRWYLYKINTVFKTCCYLSYITSILCGFIINNTNMWSCEIRGCTVITGIVVWYSARHFKWWFPLWSTGGHWNRTVTDWLVDYAN